MSKNVGSIRRSQIISTFGPGAIVDFRLSGSGALLSGVMQGLEAWEAYTRGGHKQDVVREPRLEALLGVDHFRAPPVGTYQKDGQTKDRVLPIERFPDWLSCPECHVINRSGQWAPSRNGDSLHCGRCRGKPAVVPVRFVTICENGHLNDFPWTSWLTHEAGCSRPVLALKTVGAGIGGLLLTCKSCGADRSMAEAFSPNGIPKHKCGGGRPWLGGREAIDMMIQSGDPIVFLASSLDDLHPAVEMFDTSVVSIGEIDRDVLPVLFALRYPALSDAEIDALVSRVPDLSAVALGSLEHLLLAFRQSAPEAIPKMIARYVEPLASPEEEPERKPRQPRSVVPLDDLVGLGAAKPAAQDALAALRDWQAGALAWEDVPRGILLVGPAGTGKTELARSLAGEAGVHLVTASYNEWQKAGSLSYFLSAMEESFEVARVEAPSILFIDEIDAFYTRHAVSGDGRNDSYDIKAISGFLEKLDGICDREGVIVVGACNHLDLVDPAIRRSGRFDVVAEVGLPTLEELEVILGQHLHNRGPEVDLSACAAAALGRTGADCAAAVRLAGAAARRGKRAISTEDIIAAFDGNAPKLSPDERLRLAVHEAGHAIVATALKAATVDYVRLGGSGGECKLSANRVLWTAHDLHISRCVALAGREAERLVFGSLASGSGGTADSDLAQATRSATDQICSYGMGSVGSVWLGAAGAQSSLREAIHGHLPEVAELLHSAEKAANKALALNQDLLIELSQTLSEVTVLYGTGIQAYLSRVSVSESASTTV